MNVNLNGKALFLEADQVELLAFLRGQGIDPEVPGIAVAINFSVIPRSRWPETELHDGDVIELITALQGG
jgi:sulfur carrier protein